ncbi:MAG: hypothetical protein M1819_006201 [Sarea resinae]|nr:MAG: hypothetical protein M1819_006201 [Sarea resinae]
MAPPLNRVSSTVFAYLPEDVASGTQGAQPRISNSQRDAPPAIEAPNHAIAHDLSVPNYYDSLQGGSLNQTITDHIGAFSGGPSGQSKAEWDKAFDYTFYEPENELVGEIVGQGDPAQNFDIPQAPSQRSSSTQGPRQSVSSSLPPPSRPPPKRKAGSEPSPHLLTQGREETESPALKRIARQSPASTIREGSQTLPLDHGDVMKEPVRGDMSSVAGSEVPERNGRNIETPPGILRDQKVKVRVPPIPPILPAERVFPIQIGSELFRLSGASISSDAPSYFSQFFERQLHENEDGNAIRTLYIDRDPVTFRDIALHLQGYYIKPRDGSHYVKLFADAQFYSLPRLISQLFSSEIFIQIGEKHFQIPRDIFSSPGNSPNFFSLGFALFFSSPERVFPGLERAGLLRPPSIQPPCVPHRSPEIFADLLHLLRDYPLHVRDEDHRAELLRDCRYFHLKGLEQKLIPHRISYNLKRGKQEIMIRLEDLRQSGVSFASEASADGWVNYARPFTDDTSYELVLEIGGECTRVDLRTMRAEIHGQSKARITSLFQIVANKMNLPMNQPLGLMMMAGGGMASQPVSPGNTPLSEDRIKVRIDEEADVILDGERFSMPEDQEFDRPPSRKRKRDVDEFIVRKGQWRLRVRRVDDKGRMEIVLVAVKLEAISGEQGRNAQSMFLGS